MASAIIGNFPGVYLDIRDLSQVVTANQETSCGLVGEAEFGPVFKPIQLSNLKDFTDKFGVLNATKYGYAGYSLAVAADTIGQHWFTRVVDRATCMYAGVKVPLAIPKSGAIADPDQNYDFQTVDTINKSADATSLFMLKDSEGNPTSNPDLATAFVCVASNPNNKTLKVTVKDSTVIEQKASSAISLTATPTKQVVYEGNSGDIQSEATSIEDFAIALTDALVAGGITGVSFNYNATSQTIDFINTSGTPLFITDDTGGRTLSLLSNTLTEGYYDSDGKSHIGVGTTFNPNNAQVFAGKHVFVATGTLTAQLNTGSVPLSELDPPLDTGDVVVVSGANDAGFNVTTEITANPLVVGSFTYPVSKIYPTPARDPNTGLLFNDFGTKIRYVKYPEANQTTFDLSVFEQVGKVVTKVEEFKNLTLYPAKDNYNNSSFIEDVVNGKSNYINAYANPFIDNPDEDEFNPVPSGTIVQKAFVTGASGNKPSESDMLEAWEAYKNRSEIYVTLLLNSGYVNEKSVAYQSKMLEVAEYRRDCFCLFDTPSTTSKAADVIDWRKNIQGFNTYRGALSAPWILTNDTTRGKSNFQMCPSPYVAKIMGGRRPWIAPAGPNRGQLTNSTVSPTGVTASYDDTVGGTLYLNQVNCIIKSTDTGLVNWGQKTLQMKPSALDRINVARTVIFIETTLRESAKFHLFENNTPLLRAQITMQFSQFLNTVVNDGGISSFSVVCDASNNTPYVIAQNQLMIDIYLVPTYTTEFISIVTTVTGPDAQVTIS